MPGIKIGQVTSTSPHCITIEVSDLKSFEENKESLQIGRYLRIAHGNRSSVIAVINNVKSEKKEQGDSINWEFLLECQPIGTFSDEDAFKRGTVGLPVPTEPVYITDQGTLDKIFSKDAKHNFKLGKLSLNTAVDFFVDGDKFFGKHLAVVGSTGSGKSCSVAKIIQSIVGVNKNRNELLGKQNNAHVIIFDIHSEYGSAFTLPTDQSFTVNRLDIDNLKLPYWLMNSEELESMFIESNESNSHNQVSQFKRAVILNKERHNPAIKEMTYDNPVYFSLNEVYNYIENMNKEVIGKLANENCPKLADKSLIKNRSESYFEKLYEFTESSTAADKRASNGPFYGEFNRFISRLETKLSDKRLQFLLSPKKADGSTYKTDDFSEIVKQFLGYLNKSNITIVDLSGIPFEVLSVVVSLVSRLVFDFSLHYSKIKHSKSLSNDIPFMIVCEEAHNYVPRNDSAAYASSRKSIERIAKEGRKYGLSLMVVSQRPSEVSDTIFAQCNNFISLRLTNDRDQAYIRSLFPDNSNAITANLPNLMPGECIVVGDSVLLPATIQFEKPNPPPQSENVHFYEEWNKPWKDVEFDDVIKRWRKQT